MAIAVKTFKNDKAPGMDLIEIKVLKISVREIPEQFLRLFNGCLQWGVFPKIWKEGSLRVLLKGEDKDVKDPKSYMSKTYMSPPCNRETLREASQNAPNRHGTGAGKADL